jgi:exodeoxyribonuclease VII large subunit
LPILTGIGHERDNSVADIVAHTRLKTPTAVAEFIIAHNLSFLNHLEAMTEQVKMLARGYFEERSRKVESLLVSLRMVVNGFVRTREAKIDSLYSTLSLVSGNILSAQRMRIESIENLIRARDPRLLLGKGYTMTMHNGRPLTSAKEVKRGDVVETLLRDGTVTSVVE